MSNFEKISSNVVGDSSKGNSFPHKLLLTNTQFWKLRKAFANNSSADIKFSKTQLHKIEQWGGLLGRLSGQLAKSIFNIMPLGLIAVTLISNRCSCS